MDEYSGIDAATQDVRTKIQASAHLTHPLSAPAIAVVVPAWTSALSSFAVDSTVTPKKESSLNQLRTLYDEQRSWLEDEARQLGVRSLNEHDPNKILFMGLVRDLQARFASKQNLNPHKLAVLLGERYTVE